MKTDNIKWNGTDFDSLCKEEFRKHSAIHWSTDSTIDKSIEFLSNAECTSLLDIGSGVGKFCFAGSILSQIHFTGVEIRQNLHQEAIRILKEKELQNITFIHDDVKNIDFSEFDAFYYYNPFCEYIAVEDKIDDLSVHSEENYYKYEEIILQKLEQSKKGSIVILFHAKTLQLSESFRLLDIEQDGLLSFWVKEK